jgi:hypothetical protein
MHFLFDRNSVEIQIILFLRKLKTTSSKKSDIKYSKSNYILKNHFMKRMLLKNVDYNCVYITIKKSDEIYSIRAENAEIKLDENELEFKCLKLSDKNAITDKLLCRNIFKDFLINECIHSYKFENASKSHVENILQKFIKKNSCLSRKVIVNRNLIERLKLNTSIFDFNDVVSIVHFSDTCKQRSISFVYIKSDSFESQSASFEVYDVETKSKMKTKTCDYTKKQISTKDDSSVLLNSYNEQMRFELEKKARMLTSIYSCSLDVYEEKLQNNLNKLKIIARTDSLLINTVTSSNLNSLYERCKQNTLLN